jgi:hypothetical protein
MRRTGTSLFHLLLGPIVVALVCAGSQGVSAHSGPAHSEKSLPRAQPLPPNVPSKDADAVAIQAAFGRLPLHFEAHEDENAFLSRGQGYTLVLRPFEALLSLRTSAGGSQPDEAAKPAPKLVHMQLQGGASAPHVEGLTPLRGKVNYLLGNDPAKWRTGIPTYGKVHYRDVYPGIDLVYYGNQDKLEFDFVVAPGSQPETIQLLFRGVEEARIDALGDLVLGTGDGMRLRAPTLYQEFEGKRQPVSGRYVLGRRIGSDAEPVRVSFAVGDYDATRPLVIDPVLDYSSYLGWAGAEAASDIARHKNGDLYITGRTVLSMPPPLPCIYPYSCGGQDVFVAKLDPTGATLEYVTFLGGIGDDRPAAIDVDDSGQVALGGNTDSTDFPKTNNAFSIQYRGGGDGFVVRLNADGTLRYGSYLGGSGPDGVADIATNGDYAKVTGNTGSTDFPVKNEFQGTLSGLTDAFVVSLKMDIYNNIPPPPPCELNTVTYNDCDDVIWSTYLGGDSFDVGHGVFGGAPGDTYVTGQTCSAPFPLPSNGFPVTSKAFDKSMKGSCDAFVTILTYQYPNNVSVDYSTYLGGMGWDNGHAIIASGDPAGGVLVTGETSSLDFPARDSAQLAAGGGYDAFVLRMDPGLSSSIDSCTINGLQHDNCNDLVWSSYLGGSGADYGYALATDFLGSAYVTGQTCSPDFPLVERLAYEPGINDGTNCDAFVSKFAPDGSELEYSTYLGGSADDSGAAIVIDQLTNAYVVGATSSDDFPTTQNAFQATTGGGDDDAFLSKLVVPCVGGGGPFVYLLPAAIDTDGNCLVDSGSPSDGGWQGIDVSPSSSIGGHGAKIFSASADTVWFIDPVIQQSNTVTQSPINPMQMASDFKGIVLSPDGTRLYVADHCDVIPCYVHVFDTESESAIDSLPWPSFTEAQCLNAGGTWNMGTGTCSSVPGSVGALGLAIHPNGKKLYLGNEHDSPNLYVIDIATKVATGIPVSGVIWELKVTPDGKWLYAIGAQGVDVIDATNDTHSVHIDSMTYPSLKDARNLAITPEPVFSPEGYLVYVTRQGVSALTVIRTDTHTVLSIEPGADGGTITITPDGTKAYVSSNGFMKVIDVATHQWVDSVPWLDGPKAMIGDSMGPDDTDADGIIDQVDDDPNSYSDAFSDGTSSGTIVNRAGQWVSVWGAFENGFYANARGGTQKATILACNINIKLNHNDAVKFLCGSLSPSRSSPDKSRSAW